MGRSGKAQAEQALPAPLAEPAAHSGAAAAGHGDAAYPVTAAVFAEPAVGGSPTPPQPSSPYEHLAVLADALLGHGHAWSAAVAPALGLGSRVMAADLVNGTVRSMTQDLVAGATGPAELRHYIELLEAAVFPPVTPGTEAATAGPPAAGAVDAAAAAAHAAWMARVPAAAHVVLGPGGVAALGHTVFGAFESVVLNKQVWA